MTQPTNPTPAWRLDMVLGQARGVLADYDAARADGLSNSHPDVTRQPAYQAGALSEMLRILLGTLGAATESASGGAA